jgi:prophage regulatory protein
MVYGVEYGKDGKLTQKVIGTVNKISFKKARKIAAKLLSKKQITSKPTRSEITAKPTGSEITAKPTQTQTVRGNLRSESYVTNDRAGQRQTKAADPMNSSATVPRKLVTFDELLETYSIPYTRRHIDRLEAAGKFPKRVPIGERRVAWIASEIEAHVERLIANRLNAG